MVSDEGERGPIGVFQVNPSVRPGFSVPPEGLGEHVMGNDFPFVVEALPRNFIQHDVAVFDVVPSLIDHS